MKQPAWPRSLPDGIVSGLATLGPLGRLPAPGTWGAAAGIAFFAVGFLNRYPGGDPANLVLSAFFGYLAVGICGEAAVRLGREDPGSVILDEFVAVPLCFLGWSALRDSLPAWAVLALGFGLFRFFDILKPLGIARLQSLPSGWGIVLDDTAAAIATCAVLHAGVCVLVAAQLLKK